ncbi:MAG: c-type cytochrome [Actinobacteria bacterium]|nr:c-type cytochrome [Actinomycetota bacterium]
MTTTLAAAPLSLRSAILIINALILVFLVGVAVAAVLDRRRRAVVAPNKEEYHGDEVMEGSRLERMQAWALAMGAVFAISLPAYWLIEPDRQEAQTDYLHEISVEQGAELFALNDPEANPAGLECAKCHGAEGEGGAAVFIVTMPKEDVAVTEGGFESKKRRCAPSKDNDDEVQCDVAWSAPPLNTVLLRFSREEVRDIIVYGRPGTPMPAWGLEGGGSKNDQAIDNILDFLESIQLDADEAKAAQAKLTDGQDLFQANCARCHTKHWSYATTFAQSPEFDVLATSGGGAFGFNLTGDVTLRQFPTVEDHVEFITTGSDFQAAYGTRGIGSGRMPGFGSMLTPKQIRAIVDYERSLTSERVTLDALTEKGDAPEPGTEPATGTTGTEGGEE